MSALEQLVNALRCLPGVGPKSAQRMVYHLLKDQRERGLNLAQCLEKAMRTVIHCQRCNNYTEDPLCQLCRKPNRDFTQLCVVESPSDVLAIEQSHSFQGGYFVLMGKISPLDGLGPNDIGLPKLLEMVKELKVKEAILALNPSIETQTTVHFIRELLNPLGISISQLAHGIPSGGELEFLDSYTISSALKNRATID